MPILILTTFNACWVSMTNNNHHQYSARVDLLLKSEQCRKPSLMAFSKLTIPFTKENQALPFGSQLGEGYAPPPKDVVVTWGAMATTKTIEVQTTTIDSFSLENGVKKLDFIKVDVEGHEKYVIEGGIQTFKTLKPALFLEVGAETMEDREIIADQLRGLDYEIVGIILQDGVIEVNWSQYINMKKPFEPAYYVNVLFLPSASS